PLGESPPFSKHIKNLYAYQGENKQPAILVFEGVRREESGRRSIYSRLAKGVKHLNIINVRPILDWSLIEVFLYVFLRRLELNKGYRYGLNRVGCSICPFASEWSEYILANIEEDRVNSYITIIEKHANLLGLKNKEKVSKYVADGQWKKRAGGRGLNTNGTSLNFLFNKNQLKAVIRNPREDFSEWLKVAGDVLYKEGGNNKTFGELNIGAEIFPFETETKHGKAIIKFDNIGRDIIAQSKVKRVLYKTTYCIHCGACEVECPTGALTVIPEVKINTKLCAPCGNCLNFAQRGCLAAKSLHTNIGGNKMRKKTAGIDKYSTFGMREEWLKSFFSYGNKWLESNNLGNKQVMATLHWLTDAELIDTKTKEVTQLRIYLKNIQLKEYLFAWAIFWTNIYYNSPVVRWYVNTLDWGGVFTKKELKEKIRQFYPHLSEGTLSNPVDAMVNMFDNSPLGEKMGIGTLEKKGKAVKKIKKLGTDKIHPFAVAYSLYKAAEHIGRRDFTVSELYRKEFEGGAYKLFGTSRDKLERILRGLQEDKDQILRVDLAADLDNIYLRDDLTSLDIVKILEEKTK
ncbi:MAG TPA: phosphoadenosine phosphosulfate reductase, partial [Methanophagales archaeon]|nr:phosphoadenosine phosphosulfate reductase [Methanophagales archaeon]